MVLLKKLQITFIQRVLQVIGEYLNNTNIDKKIFNLTIHILKIIDLQVKKYYVKCFMLI